MRKFISVIPILIIAITIAKIVSFKVVRGHKNLLSNEDKFFGLIHHDIKRTFISDLWYNLNDTLMLTKLNDEYAIAIWKLNKYNELPIIKIEIDSLCQLKQYSSIKYDGQPWGQKDFRSHYFFKQPKDVVLNISSMSKLMSLEEKDNYKFLKLHTEILGLGNRNEKSEVLIKSNTRKPIDFSLMLLNKNNQFYIISLSKNGVSSDLEDYKEILLLDSTSLDLQP